MFTVVENVLEALYVYQLSFYFKIHLVVVVAGILCIIWLFILECRIKNQESDPKTNKCSEKVDYFNYVVNKQKNTEEAVRQLQETPQYKQYLLDKNNPNSRLNRREEEIEEIVLSDDSDDANAQPARSKYE